MLFTESSGGRSNGKSCSLYAERSRFRNERVAAVALGLIAIAAAPAWGQCGGQMTATPMPNAGVLFTVGQSLEIEVVFGPLGQDATIASVLVSLECQDAGGCASACTDDGVVLTYDGDASISANTCSPGIESDHPAGSNADNDVVFTFVDAVGDPDPIMLMAGDTCSFRIGVTIADNSNDATPNQITGIAQTQGECTNGLPLAACGSYLIGLANPEILIVKEADSICEGEEVTYTYTVTNEGDVPLSNIVVVDDNGTPPTPPAVPAVGDDFNPTPVDTTPADGFNDGDTNMDNILDLTETWLYTHTASPTADVTNTAVVEGDYVTVADTTTVTSEDDATVVVNPNPDCEITADPPCPDSTGNTACVPDAGAGATYDWSITGGTITAGEDTNCITYTAGPTDPVHLEVTVTTTDGCTCTDELDLSLAVCGGEGCTPGYWKNHAYLWDAGCPNADPAPDVTTTVQTCDLFNATFGVTSAQSGLADTVTLLEALSVSGPASGGCNKFALARHAAAALANADSGIDFPYTTAEVIELYQDAVGAIAGDETVCTAHALLGDANELGCPCNNVGCGDEADAASNIAADTAPAPTDAGANNALCGFGVATMMPFGLIGWTFARRRRPGARSA